jgi:hypothetical protein
MNRVQCILKLCRLSRHVTGNVKCQGFAESSKFVIFDESIRVELIGWTNIVASASSELAPFLILPEAKGQGMGSDLVQL